MIEWLSTELRWGMLETSIVELLGFLTGAVCVYLNTRQNVLGWVFGIINAALYGLVFWSAKLYADFGLQGYYFFTSLYGLWLWQRGGANQTALKVTDTPPRLYPVFLLIGLTATVIWGYLLEARTDASLPYVDSGLTVASLIGQWMMARKYLQNWIVWIVADILYVAMYFYKSLTLTSFLYVIFTVLAISGYVNWKKSLLTHKLRA